MAANPQQIVDGMLAFQDSISGLSSEVIAQFERDL
jgi:hypothetical protein